jgi:hypothetical protein
MKLIIAGGTDNHIDEDGIAALDYILEEYNVTEVVSGKAIGVDTDGENWAKSRNIPVKGFPAKWDKYGRWAGHRRNQQMAKYADAVALFPGGAGTNNMAQEAKNYMLEHIFDFR